MKKHYSRIVDNIDNITVMIIGGNTTKITNNTKFMIICYKHFGRIVYMINTTSMVILDKRVS